MAAKLNTEGVGLIGRKVYIIDKDSQYYGEWGVILHFDGEQYHVSIAEGNNATPIFDRDQFKLKATKLLPVTIKPITAHLAQCNVCYARNYDSGRTIGDDIGERVDELYDVRIGQQGLTLCDACRKHVAAILTENI